VRTKFDIYVIIMKSSQQEIVIISFVFKLRFYPTLTVNVDVQVKVWCRSSYICGILYFKFSEIHAMCIMYIMDREIVGPGF
jgi:hypothetical protein